MQIGNAAHLKQVEAALASFVQDIKLAVGTRAWDLNMHRMRNAITTTQLTKTQRPGPTETQGTAKTMISGFQKNRFCEMTWENLRERASKVGFLTNSTPKSDSNTDHSTEKRGQTQLFQGWHQRRKKANDHQRKKLVASRHSCWRAL